MALTAFEERWDPHFPMIAREWRANWANLTTFFDYPPEIRKVMYTTNAIESMYAQLRKVTKKRGAIPGPDALRKVLYLAMRKASERWTRHVQAWPAALTISRWSLPIGCPRDHQAIYTGNRTVAAPMLYADLAALVLAQFRPDVHQNAAQHSPPFAVPPIAPVVVVRRVLDEFRISGRQQ